MRTHLDDLDRCIVAIHRIRISLDNGVDITPAEAAQLQVAAEDLSACADWMEAG